MPEKQTTASDVESTEPLSANGESGASHDFRAENTRLREELSKTRGLNRQAVPLVNLALALKQAPGGAAIVAKLERGEPLTEKQETAVEKVIEGSAQPGLSLEQLQGMFMTLEQRLDAKESAKEDLKALNTWADETLPGLTDVLKTPEGKRRLNVVFGMIREQAIDVPDDEISAYEFAYKQVYATLKAENPDIGKTKRVPKSEGERRGAIVKASPKSAGAPEEELSEEQAFLRRPIRRTGIGGFGKSLGEIRKH